MLPAVTTFQRVLYNPENFTPEVQDETFEFMLKHDGWWYLQNLLIEIGIAAVVVWIGLIVFRKLEANFGEEL